MRGGAIVSEGSVAMPAMTRHKLSTGDGGTAGQSKILKSQPDNLISQGVIIDQFEIRAGKGNGPCSGLLGIVGAAGNAGLEGGQW